MPVLHDPDTCPMCAVSRRLEYVEPAPLPDNPAQRTENVMPALTEVQQRMIQFFPAWDRNWDFWFDAGDAQRLRCVVEYTRKYHVYPKDPAIPVMKILWAAILNKLGRCAAWRAWADNESPINRVRTGGRRPTFDQVKRIIALAERRLGKQVCLACGRFVGECSCFECEGCHQRHPASVRCCDCGRCTTYPDYREARHEGCCKCVRCPYCRKANAQCNCAEKYVLHIDPELKFHGTPNELYPRYAGVEIEFGWKQPGHASKLNAATAKWSANVHSDGSIGKFLYSAEIATAPAKGTALVEQIHDICGGISCLQGAGVNATCGLHVHVDAKDLTGAQLLTLVRLYSKVEPALYQVVSPSRRQGRYSEPWGTEFQYANVLDRRAGIKARSERLDVLLYGSLEEAKAVKARPRKEGCRYRGLNLNAILLYGTVEFRIHQGSINPRKILNWAAVCESLVEWAATHTEREVDRISGEPFEVLCKVVGHKTVVKWLNTRRTYFTGVVNAQKKLSRLPAKLPDHEDSENDGRPEARNDEECSDCGCSPGGQDEGCDGCYCHE